MSAALINRSLTNVRTELEFLYDSEVIDKRLFDTLTQSLPSRYAKDMSPWGIEKVSGMSPGNSKEPSSEKADKKSNDVDSVAGSLQNTSLRDNLSPPPQPPVALPVPERAPAPALGYCKASFNYESSESGDLKLAKGDLLAVTEHLSPDWWKGYKKGSSPAQAGVFPSNYVTVISDTEFHESAGSQPPVNQNEKASYSSDQGFSASAPPMYQPAPNAPYQQGYQAQQPSYGGYAQYPPPSTGYYGQPQGQSSQQMQPQQQQYPPEQQPQQGAGGSNGAQHFKKFGSKLGNAAIFGAGATIGSDIVNSIF